MYLPEFALYVDTGDAEPNTDQDLYDEHNDINDPSNPIWQGSEVHQTPYGSDPTIPDPNEINQD